MKTMIALATIVLALTISGCAGKDSFADKIEANNAKRSDITGKWRDGKELKEDGEERLDDAEDDIKAAEKQIKKGEKMVADGIEQVNSNRGDYKTLSASEDDSLSPTAAGDRNKKLQDLTKQWREGEAKVEKGKQMIKNGQAKQEKAEKSMKKAEDIIARGENMMDSAGSEYDGLTADD